jgi:hypothetical protein
MKETNLTSQRVSEQEEFWSGAIGVEYIERQRSNQVVAGNISLFAEALRDSGNISSVLEFGANIGMNLRALRMLYPNASMRGVEINHQRLRQIACAEEILKKMDDKFNPFGDACDRESWCKVRECWSGK